MLFNYFTIAWRNLVKHKTTTVINIAGLALGITISLLIAIWVWDELTYNHYHRNHDRIALALSIETINGATTAEPFASVPLAGALKQGYPEAFKKLSLVAETNQVLRVGDKSIAQRGLWAQPDFPSMFTLNMLLGSQDALSDPSALLLSKSTAKALFNNNDCLHQTVQLSNTVMKVAGVYEDIPDNSRFAQTPFLLPWDNKENPGTQLTGDWVNHHFQLFVLMADNAPFAETSARIRDITKPHIKGGWEEIALHPMNKWWLYNKFENGHMVAGRLLFVLLFAAIGVFVLLLACINYMNLSTARSQQRARETGVRKVLGAGRGQLVMQFLGESGLVTLAALVLSLLMAQLSLSWFNTIAGKQLTIPYAQPLFWLLLAGLGVFTSLLAGSYPAFYLSGIRASTILKGKFRTGKAGAVARRSLVVIQFTVSVTLITGTIVVLRQIEHAKNRAVGYSREGRITINMNSPALQQHFDAIRNDLIASGAVSNMTASSSPATEVQNSMMGYDWAGRDQRSVPIIGTVFVQHDYGNTIGWQILEGRDFSRDFPADSGAFILNEAAVAFTGLQHPVGKTIRWHNKDHIIVGVVKNMIMQSPYMPAEPVFFTLQANTRIHIITINIKKGMPVADALATIAKVFAKYNPGNPFEYRFTDDAYNAKFIGEQQIAQLSSVFALFAIFISCLGLFGLASFIAEQRTKEISIRKILGASVTGIWKLLSAEFLLLVSLSLLIAFPIAFFMMNSWLQEFTYRTSLSWWIFAAAGVAALTLTLLTVSYHAIRAAVANPAEALRSE